MSPMIMFEIPKPFVTFFYETWPNISDENTDEIDYSIDNYIIISH